MFAKRGLEVAPTSAISRAAGIAEGTLFTYFRTKNDLVNALYQEIKRDLADALMGGLPRHKDVRPKLQHIWNAYVNWGIANPDKRKVLAHLRVSPRLTKKSKAVGYEPFAEIEAMTRESIAQHVLREYPVQFIAASLGALAEITMDFMASNVKVADRYRKSGFDVFWSGIAAQ